MSLGLHQRIPVIVRRGDPLRERGTTMSDISQHTENELRARYAELPATIRERIETAIHDAQIALKLRIGLALANKSEVAEHNVTQAGRIGLKSGEVSELTFIAPLKAGGAERLRRFFKLIDGNLYGASQVGTLHNMRFVFL